MSNSKKEKQSIKNKKLSSVSSILAILSICIIVFMIISNMFTHHIRDAKESLETNSAASEETAASTEEENAQAERLNTLLTQFKVNLPHL